MKLFLTVCTTLSFLTASFAQTGDAPQKKFGLRIGANYSLMNFNKGVPAPATRVTNSWKPGADVRLLLNFKLSERVALQPEYALSLMNGEDERTNTSYHMSYLSMPLLVRIGVTQKIAVIAGPQFDLLIHANLEVNGAKANITHDTEERNISVLAGIEIVLPSSFYFDVRFINGFNHVGVGQRSVTKELKWQAVSAGIGLRF